MKTAQTRSRIFTFSKKRKTKPTFRLACHSCPRHQGQERARAGGGAHVRKNRLEASRMTHEDHRALIQRDKRRALEPKKKPSRQKRQTNQRSERGNAKPNRSHLSGFKAKKANLYAQRREKPKNGLKTAFKGIAGNKRSRRNAKAIQNNPKKTIEKTIDENIKNKPFSKAIFCRKISRKKRM